MAEPVSFQRDVNARMLDALAHESDAVLSLSGYGCERNEWPGARQTGKSGTWRRTDRPRVDTCRPTVATKRSLQRTAADQLRVLAGVEAAFLSGTDDERKIIVVAREHGIVNRSELLEVEDRLVEQFGSLEISVRAHQGRGLSAFEELERII